MIRTSRVTRIRQHFLTHLIAGIAEDRCYRLHRPLCAAARHSGSIGAEDQVGLPEGIAPLPPCMRGDRFSDSINGVMHACSPDTWPCENLATGSSAM